MNLGIISDIHANPYALEVVLKEFQKNSVEVIICDGDIVGYSPLVNETFEILKKEKITYVVGNHDYYVLNECPVEKNTIVKFCIKMTKKIISEENFHFLLTLEKTKLLNIEGVVVKLVHGSPFNELEEYVYPDKEIEPETYRLDSEDLLVLGHTHHQMVKKSPASDFLIVNPGSTGQPRDAKGRACFAIFDTEQREISLRKLKYDTRGVIRALEKEDWPKALLKYF
jgi:putative phosphoesterase